MEKSEIINKVVNAVSQSLLLTPTEYSDLIRESVSDYLNWFDVEELKTRFHNILHNGGENE